MKKAISQSQIIILAVIVLAFLSLFIGSLGAKTQTVLEKLGFECAGLPGMCPKDCFKEVNKEEFLKYVGYAAEDAWVEKKPCYFETTIVGEPPTKYEVYKVMKDEQNLPFRLDAGCLFGADIYTSDKDDNTDRIEADYTKEKAMVFWTTKKDACDKFLTVTKAEASQYLGSIMTIGGAALSAVGLWKAGVPLAGAGLAVISTDANTLMVMPRDWYCLSALPNSNLYTYSMYKVTHNEICVDFENKVPMKSPRILKDYASSTNLDELRVRFEECPKFYDKNLDNINEEGVAMACSADANGNYPATVYQVKFNDDLSIKEFVKVLGKNNRWDSLNSYNRGEFSMLLWGKNKNYPLHSTLPTDKDVYIKFNGFPIDLDKDDKYENLNFKKGNTYNIGFFYYDEPDARNDMIMEINSLKCGISSECRFNNVCKRMGCAIPDPDCVTTGNSKAFKLTEYCKDKKVNEECEFLDENGKPRGVKGECLFYDDLFAAKTEWDNKLFSPLFCMNRNDGKCEENAIVPDIDCLEQTCEDKKEGDACTFKQGDTEVKSKCSF